MMDDLDEQNAGGNILETEIKEPKYFCEGMLIYTGPQDL